VDEQVLVDTSVWVTHLRKGDARLAALLEEGLVATHPFVIGELACGSLAKRTEILSLLRALPSVQTAEHDEVLLFLEKRQLMGRGLGWVDVHLLASAVLSGVAVWTLDKPLARACEEEDLRY
jgi:predicted nucleic acid-binding protein